MKLWFLMLFAFSAEAADPTTCHYWLERLTEVARLEATLKVDIETVRRRDGVWAAQEFKMEVQEQLWRLRQKIEKEQP